MGGVENRRKKYRQDSKTEEKLYEDTKKEEVTRAQGTCCQRRASR